MLVDWFLRLTVIFIAFLVSIMTTAAVAFYTLQGPIAASTRSINRSVNEVFSPGHFEAGLDRVLTLLEIIGAVIGGTTLTAALLTAVALIILGEALGLRSWMYYVLGGGLVMGMAAAIQGFDFALIDMAVPGFALSLVAAGFAGGGVYWFLAGRRAGRKIF